MKVPAALNGTITRFDRMTLRERLLIFGAVLAVVITLWQSGLMDRLNRRQHDLSLELTDLEQSVSRVSHATETVANSDPTTLALRRLQDRQKALDAINAKLVAESAGLIPPSQMVEVIHDVLKHQQGLTLVSLKNLPVTTLVPALKATGTSGGQADANSAPRADANGGQTGAADASGAASATQAQYSGPYLHPVELVIEGRYLDIVAYLQALEGLPWRFYWRVLELQTKTYPLNRVRIELSTVSLDKEWIGV